MSKLLTSFLFVLPGAYLFAQDVETPPSFQKDIGFNTTFLLQGIFESDYTPFSLMYKKYSSPNKALRLGIDAFANLNETTSETGTSSYSETSAGSIALVVGKEFQKQIDKRWTWYYGADIAPFFSFNKQDSYVNGDLTIESDNKTYGMSLRPFLGIRFNINPRLYLTAEANLGIQYASVKNYSAYEGNVEPYTDTKISHFSFSLNPASGLFLFYRF